MISDRLRQLHYTLSEAVGRLAEPSRLARPTPRDSYEELRQLHEEFERVDVQLDLISIVTGPVELEGIFLGAFRVELRIQRMAERHDVSAFNIVALDPHPAAADSNVVHPHVRDGQLCAGEATMPSAYALADGRLCDAFLSVSSVLSHYNAGSPYVHLSEWEGESCADCGYIVGDDERHWCEYCEQDYCGECCSFCEICDSSCCRGCLEQDRESARLCCRQCRRHCSRCNRMVDADNFVEETELCPECHDNYTQEQEEEQTHDNNDKPDPSPEAIASNG